MSENEAPTETCPAAVVKSILTGFRMRESASA